MKKPLLTFQEYSKGQYIVYNHEQLELGWIEKERVGRFLHWTFSPNTDTFYTNGCLKEIVEFITKLYREEKSK